MSNEVAALAAQLSETELFGGIGESLLPQVARVFTRQSVRAGTVLFEQATPVASVYVVARVALSCGAATSRRAWTTSWPRMAS